MHPVAALQRYEGLRPRSAGSVQVRARLPAKVQDVLEAGSGHERSARAFALQQSVRRHRRPVCEPLHLSGSGLARSGHDRLLLPPRREQLRRRHPPLVQQHCVGERAANVDAENCHPTQRSVSAYTRA